MLSQSVDEKNPLIALVESRFDKLELKFDERFDKFEQAVRPRAARAKGGGESSVDATENEEKEDVPTALIRSQPVKWEEDYEEADAFEVLRFLVVMYAYAIMISLAPASWNALVFFFYPLTDWSGKRFPVPVIAIERVLISTIWWSGSFPQTLAYFFLNAQC